jgi:transcription initiation factor TFIIB
MVREKEKQETIEVCPECGSRHIVRDYERAELVCEDCGLVLDDNFIDQGAEWRAFDSEQSDKRARTGSAMTFTIHDKGLSTEISWKNKDSYGKSIPTRNRAQMYRLRKWQKRVRVSNATERNLAAALSELERLSSAMGLPRNVRETAALIYRKAVQKNLIRGRSIEGVVASSVYAACRQCGVPRTLDEVSDFSRIKRKEIGRTYRFMTRELKLKLLPTKPQDYIQRFCSELKLSGNTQNKAIEILKDATDKELTSGRGPTGVAAAPIYIASILTNERRTQREVADVAGVTEVTIRNRYKELNEKLGMEITL